jgi:hypothetical protein
LRQKQHGIFFNGGNMKRSISFLLAFITILLFTSSTSTIVRMDRGEPVPGAEILVEQDGVPIAHCITDYNGGFTISFPPGVKIPKSGVLILTITPPQITAKDRINEISKHRGIEEDPPKKLKATGGGDPLSGLNVKLPQKITVKYVIKNGIMDAWDNSAGGPYSHAHSNVKGVKEVMDVDDKMDVDNKGHDGLNGSDMGGRKILMLKFTLIWNPPIPSESNKGGFAVSGHNMS